MAKRIKEKKKKKKKVFNGAYKNLFGESISEIYLKSHELYERGNFSRELERLKGLNERFRRDLF